MAMVAAAAAESEPTTSSAAWDLLPRARTGHDFPRTGDEGNTQRLGGNICELGEVGEGGTKGRCAASHPCKFLNRNKDRPLSVPVTQPHTINLNSARARYISPTTGRCICPHRIRSV